MDLSAMLKFAVWLAILGGAVLIAAKLVGTAGSKAAAVSPV